MKSVLQDEKKCYVCGTTANLHRHHVLYGVANRKKSEARGFTVFLCRECHEGNSGVHLNPNTGIDLELKQTAQLYYEMNIGTREDFIKEFGKNYLD